MQSSSKKVNCLFHECSHRCIVSQFWIKKTQNISSSFFLVLSQFGAHWRIRMTGQILPFLNMAQSFKYMPDGRSLVNTKTEFLHLAECFKRRISLYRYEYINSNEKSNKYKSSLLRIEITSFKEMQNPCLTEICLNWSKILGPARWICQHYFFCIFLVKNVTHCAMAWKMRQ